MTADQSHSFLESSDVDGDIGRLGHYRVLRELGRGGMGYVFEALDAKLQRSVALKVMNQRIASTAGSRKRFISEARAMAAVRHDNVATIYEVGQRGDTPFMAMEMLVGETLETLKERGRPDFRTVIELTKQMAAGLQAAHQRGIVHRDIKPANLWVESPSNRIKILDFGLALASTPMDPLAGRGSVVGTPGYLSPEQARGEPLDDRSDLYSLGAVLYDWCTGVLPIRARSVPEQMLAILLKKPEPIDSINPEIPKPLCNLIHKLLRKEPRSRISCAGELLEELEKVEDACVRSSEMAQAIDKLKVGLESVVDKSATAPVPDPTFASLPPAAGSGVMPAVPIQGMGDSGQFATPMIPGVASPSGIGPSPGSGIGTAPGSGIGKSPGSGIGTAPRSGIHRKSSPEPTSSGPPPYVWLIGIGVIAVIALPVMTYLFSQSGSTKGNIVIDPTGGGVKVANNPNGSNIASPQNGNKIDSRIRRNSNQGTPAGSNQLSSQSSGNRNQSANGNQRFNGNQNRQYFPPNQNNNNQNTGPKGQRGSIGDAYAANNKSYKPATGGNRMGNNGPSGENGRSNSGDFNAKGNRQGVGNEPSGRTPSNGNGSTRNSPPDSDTSPPKSMALKTKVIAVSPNRGDGADAMVRRGSNEERYGAKNSIGVRTRRSAELNHSYIRFDLSEESVKADNIRSVSLVLTTKNGQRPVGAVVRVHGVQDEIPWPENELDWGRSFSRQGINVLPMLASVTVGKDGNNAGKEDGEAESNQGDGAVIRITGEELSRFVRDRADKKVTLVLAGKFNDELLSFHSRESGDATAPRLDFEVSP